MVFDAFYDGLKIFSWHFVTCSRNQNLKKVLKEVSLDIYSTYCSASQLHLENYHKKKLPNCFTFSETSVSTIKRNLEKKSITNTNVDGKH